MPARSPPPAWTPGGPTARRRAARPAPARAACALAALLCGAPSPAAAPFVDPLDTPAQPSALAPRALLSAVTAAGPRLVAVGQRGHVVYSDDGGVRWAQGAVPVSVDLNAVHFASPERGWAVGHGGVVLATADGGRTWVKQLDAHRLEPLLRAYAVHGVPPAAARQALDLATEAANASLLDVWFDDERSGFAVGAFNLVLRTEDGGESWMPWLDHVENPEGLHLYAIRRVAGALYAVGERGLVLRQDEATGRLRALSVPYAGTLFGVTGTPGCVIAFGLRGHVVRSADGARWQVVRTGVESAVTAGTVTPDGRIVLVTEAGEALVGSDGDGPLRPVALGRRLPTSSLAPAGAGAVALVGGAGVRIERLP